MKTIKTNNTLASTDTDSEFTVKSLKAISGKSVQEHKPWWNDVRYLIVGTFFGIVFVKAEIISWFRIQEMFRLQGFHMYGVIGTAVVVGAISVWLIKRFKVRALTGEPVVLQPKQFNKGQIYGGLLFGFGWAITGACPGPLFAQIGAGYLVVVVTLLSAIAGTWVYGRFRERLPH